jgi:transposase-like protein
MLRADPPTPPPQTCPFCKSGEITTTGKSVTDDQYWRCTTCGQVWNPARLVVFQRSW